MALQNAKPTVGFILGDPAGIGPEIVLKVLKRPKLYKQCQPVLIGNYDLLCGMADKTIPELFLLRYSKNELPEDKAAMFSHGMIPVVDVPADLSKVTIGTVTGESGLISYHSIIQAFSLLERKYIDGVIMAPINKEALSKSGCGYHSEYELFADLAGVPEVQSVVKGGNIFRSSVIGHVPFREILERLSTEKIVKTTIGLNRVLQSFGYEKPKIAISALNPHGGEGGTMGVEEAVIIQPAIERLRGMGIMALGPYPADTIFNRAMKAEVNGVIHLYHDQGNIAMKTQMFESTAIIYTNLPYFVLSTGHGSALDIADLGIANPTNLTYVISTLAEMFQHRLQKA
ncbi:MAG TPA: 4-hydroxythreonine-4-phosphate dehydrogenase PdxA [Rectinemataceae bacterium]|nr:4-hydroxythreonine-4-phosphate dehydrogenase PdxA [Rectinemataceae bacterium]